MASRGLLCQTLIAVFMQRNAIGVCTWNCPLSLQQTSPFNFGPSFDKSLVPATSVDRVYLRSNCIISECEHEKTVLFESVCLMVYCCPRCLLVSEALNLQPPLRAPCSYWSRWSTPHNDLRVNFIIATQVATGGSNGKILLWFINSDNVRCFMRPLDREGCQVRCKVGEHRLE